MSSDWRWTLSPRRVAYRRILSRLTNDDNLVLFLGCVLVVILFLLALILH